MEKFCLQKNFVLLLEPQYTCERFEITIVKSWDWMEHLSARSPPYHFFLLLFFLDPKYQYGQVMVQLDLPYIWRVKKELGCV